MVRHGVLDSMKRQKVKHLKLRWGGVLAGSDTKKGDRSSHRPTYPARERLAAFRADEGRGNKVGVVVALEVHVQQLLLPEGLLTLAAGVWLLARVGAAVHHHVALLPAAVVTHVTLEALLVLVGLLVLDEGVSLVEHGVAVATLLARLDERMLLAQVNA